MLWNVLILVAVLLAATVIGILLRRNAGHFRGAPRRVNPISLPGRAPRADSADANDAADAADAADAGMTIDPADLPHRLGERATLLQFSSAFCAPCRTTRRVLADVAAVVPGVAHVEIDAEHHLDLVRRAGVMRTPTTLMLDAAGREVTRASGAPSKAAVIAALGRTIESDDVNPVTE
ncbi:MAG: thioredoxin family protein [Nocardioidaceae bacterium]